MSGYLIILKTRALFKSDEFRSKQIGHLEKLSKKDNKCMKNYQMLCISQSAHNYVKKFLIKIYFSIKR